MNISTHKQYSKIKDIIKIDINNLRKYIDNSIVLFNNESDNRYNDFLSEYDIPHDEIPGTMFNQILSNDPDLILFGSFSPDILKKSTLIVTYSILEVLLKLVCEISKHGLQLKIDAKDLKGSDIERYLKYLDKVVGINMVNFDSIIGKIHEYRHIRNCVVHNISNVDESGNKITLLKIINTNSSLMHIEQTGEFYIRDEAYLHDFIDIIEEFINSIIKELEKLMPSS